MIDLQIHFRGQGTEARQSAALPAVGSYLRHGGGLWRVAAVAMGERVDVYAVAVGEALANELTEAWAAWGEPAADVTTEGNQRCE